MQETLQGRGMALLIGQALGEKGLDRLARLGAQPGQQTPPAPIGPEHPGEKLERRHEVGPLQP